MRNTVEGSFVHSSIRFARSVAKLFRTKTLERATLSVPQTVELDGATRIDSITKTENANTAAKSFRAKSLTRLGFAPELVQVLSVEKTPLRLPVYNVSVEGEPEFFANGILVHNCKYLVMSHPEPTSKSAKEMAAEAVAPLVEQGDLHSANIRYGQALSRLGQSKHKPIRVGRR